ncbi:MAG: hypothetical protein ACREQ4_16815, partial [Candidatus Binataceae bacterium]
FGTVTRNKGRLEQGGTQVDVGTATGISHGAAARIAALDATAYSSGTETNGLIREYARQLAKSPKAARSGILRDAYHAIYDALEKDFGAQTSLGGITPEAGPGQGNLLTGTSKPLPPRANNAATEPEPTSPSAAELGAAGQGGIFAAPEGGGKGYTDFGAAVIPGAREFVEQDVVPTVKQTLNAAVNTRKGLKKLLAPASASKDAFTAATIVSRRRSELANDRALVERGLRKLTRYMDSQPEAVKDNFIDRMERGQAQRTPELQEIANTLRTTLDQRRESIQKLGKEIKKPLLEHFHQDYFPHLWQDSQKAEQVFQRGPRGSLSGPGSFLKHRTFDYYAEGKAEGLKPVTDNPVTMVGLKDYEMAKYESGVRIMQDLKEQALLKFIRGGARPPAGYVRVNDKLARVFRPVEVLGKEIGEATLNQREMYEPEAVTVHETHPAVLKAGEWYAPADVSRIIDHYLSPGLRSVTGETPVNAYDALRSSSNIANQVQLGMSAFHLTTTTANAGVSDLALALQRGVKGEFKDAVKSFIRSTPGVGLAQDLLGPGRKMFRQFHGVSDYGPEYEKAVGDYIKSGANFEQSREFIDNWSDDFRAALAHGNPIGAVLRAPLAVLEQAAKPLFQYLVPRAKAAAFFRLNEFEQAKLPAGTSEMDRLKAAYQVQNTIDNRFGELNYDKLWWNNKAKDLAFVALRAPGWLLGTMRELGGGAADLASGKGLTARAAYTIALPVWTALWGSMLQYAVTGTFPKVEENARDTLRNFFAPIIGPNGVRGWLPTYMKEVYHLGAALDGLYYGDTRPASGYIASKLNPTVQLGSDLIRNRTYPDTQVRNPEDPIGAQIGEVLRHEGSSLLPFTVQNLVRERELGASASTAGTLSSLGVTPAPRALQQSAFENYIDSKIGARMPEEAMTQEQAKRFQRRRQAITDLRAGKSADLRGLGKGDLNYILREVRQPPIVDRAMRLSLPELAQGLRYATPDEKKAIVGVINEKLKRIGQLPPEQQGRVVDELRTGMGG